MTYDQWKTTDMSQEGRVCSCGSGEWAYCVEGNKDWRRELWVCEACEDDRIERALMRDDREDHDIY